MGLFNNNRATKELDDTIKIVNDFIRQVPYASYRPVSYKISDEFVNFKDQIDTFLEALFAGKIDEANGDALDNLIGSKMRIALQDLETQRISHDDTIDQFVIQAAGAKISFENFLAVITEKSRKNQERLDDIEARYNNDKFVGGRK